MTPRLARADEAKALARLIDAAYQPYREQGIALPDVSAGLPEVIGNGQVWVIGEPVVLGVLVLSLDPPEAHLVNVAVAPEGQGQGIGGRLIRHAVAQAQEAGCASIALATHRELAGNIALYQSLGWEEVSRDGDRVMMRRTLPS